jgi:hypothetical protein
MVLYLACEMKDLKFSVREYRYYALLDVMPCNLTIYQITLRHIAEVRKTTQHKCWDCSVSNLKTAPLIQKTNVHKISILLYLRLLETVLIQMYIYQVKLKK